MGYDGSNQNIFHLKYKIKVSFLYSTAAHIIHYILLIIENFEFVTVQLPLGNVRDSR